MRSLNTQKFFIALILISTTSLGSAKVYKWVDADGAVHYSDQPQGSQDAPIVTPTGPAAAPTLPAADQQRRLIDALKTERLEREERIRQAEAQRAERERNCQIARHRLQTFTDAGYLYELDENGEKRIYSDTERQASESSARADVAKWCD